MIKFLEASAPCIEIVRICLKATACLSDPSLLQGCLRSINLLRHRQHFTLTRCNPPFFLGGFGVKTPHFPYASVPSDIEPGSLHPGFAPYPPPIFLPDRYIVTAQFRMQTSIYPRNTLFHFISKPRVSECMARLSKNYSSK